MMRLDPDDFSPTATEHSGPCSARSLCDSCAADLALLVSKTDPLAQIASAALPEGWYTVRDPRGRSGETQALYDDQGDYRGSYGWVRDSYRSGATPGHWEAGGVRQPSEQACIDHLASRGAAE